MTFICELDDIPDVEEKIGLPYTGQVDETPSCLEKEVEVDGENKFVFLLKHDGNVKAYINACPHTGAKLNWQPGVFLDSEKHYIMCTIHGALFEKESGLCVYGPCAKQHLSSLAIKVEEGKVYLER